MKKIISVILVLILMVGGTVGCSQKSGDIAASEQTATTSDVSGEAESADTEEEAVITLWWAEQDEYKAPLLEAIMDFEEEHPNIKIEVEWTPNFDYYNEYKIDLTGGDAPDVVKIDHVYVQSLGYYDQIWDLEEFGASEEKDKFVEATWNANKYMDHTYAFPFDANTLALMYNKDLLDKAGVSVPTTLDELITAAKAVSDLGISGVYGYTSPFDPGNSGFLSYQFTGWIARNGGTILNEDWTKATVNTPEVINALKQVKSLIDTGAAPEGVFMENDFYAGSIGMLEMGCWNVPTITSEDAAANFGVAPMVSLADGVPAYSPLGLYSLAITKTCKYPEQTYEFVKYLATNEKLQLAYSKATNLMPSLTACYEDEFYDDEVWQVFIDQLKNTVSRPGTPAWPEIDQILNDMVQSVILDEATPKEATADAETKINEALAAIEE